MFSTGHGPLSTQDLVLYVTIPSTFKAQGFENGDSDWDHPGFQTLDIMQVILLVEAKY